MGRDPPLRPPQPRNPQFLFKMVAPTATRWRHPVPSAPPERQVHGTAGPAPRRAQTPPRTCLQSPPVPSAAQGRPEVQASLGWRLPSCPGPARGTGKPQMAATQQTPKAQASLGWQLHSRPGPPEWQQQRLVTAAQNIYNFPQELKDLLSYNYISSSLYFYIAIEAPKILYTHFCTGENTSTKYKKKVNIVSQNFKYTCQEAAIKMLVPYATGKKDSKHKKRVKGFESASETKGKITEVFNFSVFHLIHNLQDFAKQTNKQKMLKWL
ncbi:hypothetical protein QTO34_017182 [Cnephaeus nilssonii]|uniref:Uncharacterized protein n=1 Tax=Cnephaeus nilssonii TaxID=3371016 RepID=A0AA40I0I1_CNENI|nr:hypothetical protein QTO34_017182 [Eptesicus nilssonii]